MTQTPSVSLWLQPLQRPILNDAPQLQVATTTTATTTATTTTTTTTQAKPGHTHSSELIKSRVTKPKPKFAKPKSKRKPKATNNIPLWIQDTICIDCLSNTRRPHTVYTLQTRLATHERKYANLVAVCRSCEGASGCWTGPVYKATATTKSVPYEPPEATISTAGVACECLDCPVYYARKKQASELVATRDIVEPILRSLDLEW